MEAATVLHRIGACAALVLLGVPTAQRADAQAWDAVKYFQYNIENSRSPRTSSRPAATRCG